MSAPVSNPIESSSLYTLSSVRILYFACFVHEQATLSPTETVVTPSPTASTTPAMLYPFLRGNFTSAALVEFMFASPMKFALSVPELIVSRTLRMRTSPDLRERISLSISSALYGAVKTILVFFNAKSFFLLLKYRYLHIEEYQFQFFSSD